MTPLSASCPLSLHNFYAAGPLVYANDVATEHESLNWSTSGAIQPDTFAGGISTQTGVFAALSMVNSANSLQAFAVNNQNAGSSATATMEAETNAGSAYLQASSTAGGPNALLTSTVAGPFYISVINAAGSLVFRTGAGPATALTIANNQAATFASTVSATLASAATTSAVCYNTSSGLFSYDSTIGTCNTSDERLKTFDGPLTDSLAKLAALGREERFGYFHGDASVFGPGEHIGLGAQTVARYFPELTATGDNGTMSLAYDKLTVPIIAALGTIVESCRAAANDNFCIELLKRIP